jgi:hypothetical protein
MVMKKKVVAKTSSKGKKPVTATKKRAPAPVIKKSVKKAAPVTKKVKKAAPVAKKATAAAPKVSSKLFCVSIISGPRKLAKVKSVKSTSAGVVVEHVLPRTSNVRKDFFLNNEILLATDSGLVLKEGGELYYFDDVIQFGVDGDKTVLMFSDKSTMSMNLGTTAKMITVPASTVAESDDDEETEQSEQDGEQEGDDEFEQDEQQSEQDGDEDEQQGEQEGDEDEQQGEQQAEEEQDDDEEWA